MPLIRHRLQHRHSPQRIPPAPLRRTVRQTFRPDERLRLPEPRQHRIPLQREPRLLPLTARQRVPFRPFQPPPRAYRPKALPEHLRRPAHARLHHIPHHHLVYPDTGHRNPVRTFHRERKNPRHLHHIRDRRRRLPIPVPLLTRHNRHHPHARKAQHTPLHHPRSLHHRIPHRQPAARHRPQLHPIRHHLPPDFRENNPLPRLRHHEHSFRTPLPHLIHHRRHNPVTPRIHRQRLLPVIRHHHRQPLRHRLHRHRVCPIVEHLLQIPQRHRRRSLHHLERPHHILRRLPIPVPRLTRRHRHRSRPRERQSTPLQHCRPLNAVLHR